MPASGTTFPKSLYLREIFTDQRLSTIVCYKRSEDGVSTHLYRRQGGTYYFRRAIPASVRHLFSGRREWIVSLHTKDRGEAKGRLPAHVIAFDDAVAKAFSLAEGKQLCDDSTNDVGLILQRGVYGALPVSERRSGHSIQKDKVPLLETFEAYAVDQGIKAGTAAEWRAIIKALVQFLGHDDAAKIRIEDLDRWCDTLLKKPGLRGRCRSARTIKDKHVCALKATLRWAVEKRKLVENVALNLRVRAKKVAILRDKNFSADEARLILQASLKSNGVNLARHEAEARRWVPWLCAYTGARVNEIGQLRGKDVSFIDGIWTLVITPDAGTVKSGSARVVPLHSDIIDQGFLDYVKSVGDEPLFYDPSRVRTPNAANRYKKKVGERLGNWIRDDLGLTDPGIQPNHGWRHTFKTLAIDVGIPERVADAIQGHAPRSVSQAYGSVSLASRAVFERAESTGIHTAAVF